MPAWRALVYWPILTTVLTNKIWQIQQQLFNKLDSADETQKGKNWSRVCLLKQMLMNTGDLECLLDDEPNIYIFWAETENVYVCCTSFAPYVANHANWRCADGVLNLYGSYIWHLISERCSRNYFSMPHPCCLTLCSLYPIFLQTCFKDYTPIG